MRLEKVVEELKFVVRNMHREEDIELHDALTSAIKILERVNEFKDILSKYGNCDNPNCGNGAICNYCALKIDLRKLISNLTSE